MSEKTYIYGLLDPTDEKLHYVGKSNNPVQRYKQHVQWVARVPRSAVERKTRNWITGLQSKGFIPKLVILQEVEAAFPVWSEAERHWAEKLLEEGHPLVNNGERALNNFRRHDRAFREALKLGQEMFGDPNQLVDRG